MSPLEFCAYLETLALKNISPATIANKCSQIRQWINNMDGSTVGIYHKSVKRWLEAINKTTTYQSRPKDPVPVSIVKQVVNGFKKDLYGWQMRSAILLIAYGGYMQGEVMPHTPDSFNHECHLTRGDVLLFDDAVKVTIKFGKNYSKFNQGRVSVFYKNENPEYCVVNAVSKLYSLQPTVSPQDPMFKDPVTNLSLPLYTLRKEWEQAIRALGQDPVQYSLHSIRKTTMSLAYYEGVQEHDIRQYGAWQTNTHRTYIKTRAGLAVNAAIRKHYK